MQILAGTEQRLTFQDGAFEVSSDGDWVIKSLNYFQNQELVGSKGVDHVIGTLRYGLVTAPGATVDEFLASPLPHLVHPLYQAIWAHTLGN